MLFIELIAKNLRRRLPRTLLTILGLAVAVTATTTLWNIAWGYAESAHEFYAARDVDIVVVRAGVANRLTSNLRADLAVRLNSLPGVDDVDASLTEMVSVGNAIIIGIPLRGIAADGFTMQELQINDGRPLKPGDRGHVLLGGGIAAALGKRSGDKVEIEGKQFQISGLIEAANPFDTNSIVAPLDDVQTLMGRPGIISEFQLRAAKSIRDDASLRELSRDIEALQNDAHEPLGLKAQPTHQFINTATESRLGNATAWAITAIVIVLSFVSVLNTMLMSVVERTKELGILRAVGWKKSRVLSMILGESAAISIVAALAGSVISWALVIILSNWSRTSLLMPAGVSAAALTPGIVVAVVAGIAGALYPALHAASVQPVESLRYE
jgi:putative ABC transport system permease protein